MSLIDRYSYNNRMRYVHPAYKIGLATAVITLCLLFNQFTVSLAAIGWMGILLIGIAQLPIRMIASLLMAEATFLLLSLWGLVFSVNVIHTSPLMDLTPLPEQWQWQIGLFTVSTSTAALWTALQIGARSLAAVSALNFLALTTPTVDLIAQLRHWHFPELLLDLMGLIYRFIFVLLDSMGRMVRAQQSRLGYAGRRQAMQSAALVGSQLFMESYRRSARLQTALDSRGYHGSLCVLMPVYRADQRWLCLFGTIILSLISIGLLL